jgi:hypothetical protein
MTDKSINPEKWVKKHGHAVKTSVSSTAGRHNLHATDGKGHHFSSVHADEQDAHETARKLRGFKGSQAGNSSGKNTTDPV